MNEFSPIRLPLYQRNQRFEEFGAVWEVAGDKLGRGTLMLKFGQFPANVDPLGVPAPGLVADATAHPFPTKA